jgi:hypothetical protein
LLAQGGVGPTPQRIGSNRVGPRLKLF